MTELGKPRDEESVRQALLAMTGGVEAYVRRD
jgi:hypothetical protein